MLVSIDDKYTICSSFFCRWSKCSKIFLLAWMNLWPWWWNLNHNLNISIFFPMNFLILHWWIDKYFEHSEYLFLQPFCLGNNGTSWFNPWLKCQPRITPALQWSNFCISYFWSIQRKHGTMLHHFFQL